MTIRQQTIETIQEHGKLFEILNFRKTPPETDQSIAEYFEEKAAKAKKREDRDASR